MQSDQPPNKCWEVNYDFNGPAGRNPYIQVVGWEGSHCSGDWGGAPRLLLSTCLPELGAALGLQAGICKSKRCPPLS